EDEKYGLDEELEEMREGMDNPIAYGSRGRAYMLSGLDAHSKQRATARGTSSRSFLNAIEMWKEEAIMRVHEDERKWKGHETVNSRGDVICANYPAHAQFPVALAIFAYECVVTRKAGRGKAPGTLSQFVKLQLTGLRPTLCSVHFVEYWVSPLVTF
ncbi:E3 ubiquitin protein ligase WAV3, partial [Tanacetum coccineum]